MVIISELTTGMPNQSAADGLRYASPLRLDHVGRQEEVNMAEPWEVWNQIIEKASSRGVGDLNDFEENIYRVNIFLCDMDNGGLTGFLYNVSPSNSATSEWNDLRQTAKAIEIMGVSACADALFQAASCFESVSNAEKTWGQLLEDPKLAELIKAIEQPIKEAILELWEKLEDFTLQKMPV